jgi:hypothetical protein
MLTWLSIAAAGLVLLLCRDLVRRLRTDRIDALAEKRRAGSLVVSRGEFVDGNRRIAVAMALTKRTLFYENDDLEASLELHWVGEVEYDTRLGTGTSIEEGEVLRLRCYSQGFEFILPADAVMRWQTVLPAHRAMPDAAGKEIALQVATAV